MSKKEYFVSLSAVLLPNHYSCSREFVIEADSVEEAADKAEDYAQGTWYYNDDYHEEHEAYVYDPECELLDIQLDDIEELTEESKKNIDLA